ncbi:MAG: type II secretion system protein [Burkholderiales bacterium]|jgi:prepilin-type N-terminal cleavage/methylation domain-containing protein
MNSPNFRIRASLGFSLIEIAVVLVIIAILVTAIGVPLASQLDQQRTLDTQRQLDSIKEALYGYAMANGRLPCPASETSNGAEAFAGSGSAADGDCSSTSGWVPAATLGLSPVDSSGYFVDAWGLTANRVRYAVSKINYTTGAPTGCPATLTYPLTKTDGIKGATMGCLANTSANVNLLSVRSTTVSDTPNGCTPADLSVKAPFVVFSLGKNASTGGTGADEAQNVTPNATTFVSHTPTPSGNCAGEFDDIVTWGSLNILFSRMVQAGKLP